MLKIKFYILIILIFVGITGKKGFANNKELVWSFPLQRTHTGMLIGNGTQGLMIWGQENQLNITIGHQGFWDHRAGNNIFNRVNFQELKKLLYDKDEEKLTKAFEVAVNKNDPDFGRPKQIGGGRLEILFPTGYKLSSGVLDLKKGEARISILNEKGQQELIVVRQSVNNQLAWVKLPTGVLVTTKLISSWDHIKSVLERGGIKPPEVWQSRDIRGFVQSLPSDKPLAIAYKTVSNTILMASYIGDSPKENISKLLANNDMLPHQKFADDWWKAYWASVPEIKLPDTILQEIVDYGLYKQACVTPPHAKAAGLQGPFVEEYQLIPWSNDFHFNINVQMIYTPAFASNRPQHLTPLWSMIHSWMPTLKAYGETFFQHKGAVIIPHAVDDRAQVIGKFWTGTIDHACTAWVSYMAWQNYRYTMDESILRKTAWPLLNGAFEGFWAMLEEIEDGHGGKRYSLPVSVSPEYGGSKTNAWGRDASFQLAALHKICELLPRAANLIGEPIDTRWADVQKRLPRYTTVNDVWFPENQERGERIALWEGQDLDGSHRHHSHLAGIFPFCTLNPKQAGDGKIISNTIKNWMFKGPGNWSAWSMPWASTIWSRLEKPEAAVMWLHYWQENFVNEGRGTLYKAAFEGSTLISGSVNPKDNSEIMQLDAGMDALNAVYEMLVQNRDDVIVVLPSIHKDWKELRFDNILTEGAFLVSATVNDGKTSRIKINSQKGGMLKVIHGFGKNYKVNGEKVNKGTTTFQVNTSPGEEIILERTL